MSGKGVVRWMCYWWRQAICQPTSAKIYYQKSFSSILGIPNFREWLIEKIKNSCILELKAESIESYLVKSDGTESVLEASPHQKHLLELINIILKLRGYGYLIKQKCCLITCCDNFGCDAVPMAGIYPQISIKFPENVFISPTPGQSGHATKI